MALVRFYFKEDYDTPKKELISPWWKVWEKEYRYKYDMEGFFHAWAQLEFALIFDGKVAKKKIVKG